MNVLDLIVCGTKITVITKLNDIHLNHTDLGANVKVTDTVTFQKKRSCEEGKEEIPKEN